MNKIKLSIIIPVYNTERYLKRCLSSVINQMEEWVELIVVDDGSSDGSPEICDQFMNKYSNVNVIHKENGGLSSARNEGLRKSQGEYVAFLDSDDMFESSFIQDLNEYLKLSWDILDFKYCFEKGKDKYKPQGTKNKKLCSRNQYIDLYNKNEFGNQICFRVYKKRLFDEIEFPIGRYYEDIATFYKLMLKADNILMIDYEYYIYNIWNENSITKRISRKCMEDMISSVDEMCDGLCLYCDDESIEFLNYNKINQYVYILFKLIQSNEEVDDLKKHIMTYLKGKKIKLQYLKLYNYKKYIVFKVLNIIGIIR